MERSLPREAYWDEAFFAREQRAIFWDQWFYAGRAERIAETGAYRVVDIAGESVVIVRAEEGAIRPSQFLPPSREPAALRGGRRARRDSLPVSLVGVRPGRPSARLSFRSARRGAARRPAAASGGGRAVGRISLRTPRARACGRPARSARRDSRAARALSAAGAARRELVAYEVDANWKVMLENYNECYHCAGVHPELCRLVPAFKQRRRRGARLGTRNSAP